MIRWAKLGRGAEGYYLGPVAEGAEPPGRWWGAGPARLGIGPGPVAPDDLVAVLGGRHPGDGGRLTPRPTRVAGFDLTCAVPKSVSLLWALGAPEVAAEVDVAHRSAAEATLGYLERRAVRDGSPAGPLVAAGFQHHLSRAGDAHVHLHLVVANLRGTPDGRWRALDSPPLLAHLPTAGFLFESHLRHELTRRLAVRFGPVVDGVAQLEGVDAEVRAAFSSRRQQVRRGMADHGGSSPRSARVAALDGRPPKRPGERPDELRAGWRRRAAELGLGPDRVAALTGVGAGGGGEVAMVPSRVTARIGASSFSRRDVIRAVCSELPGGAAVESAERMADEVLRSAEVVALTGPAPLRAADVMRAGGRMVPVGTDTGRWVTREEAARQQRLAADAAGAVRSGAGIELLSGPPGPARWAALSELRRRMQASGVEVAAVAPDRRSALELEAATGIPTVALTGGLPSPPPALLVVSGAEALASPDAAALVDLAAGGRTRLVLVGDPGAVPRVDRAGAWRALESAVGASPAPPLPSRGADESPAPAAAVVRVGDRMVLAAGQEDLRRRLVADWLGDPPAGRGPAGLRVMVAMRRADVDDLNGRAAARLLEQGRLGEETAPVGRHRLHHGDTVLVAGSARGSPLRPGGLWVLDARGPVPRLRSGEGRVVELAGAGPVDLRRGYAMTPYQARLVSPVAALVLGDPLLYQASPGPADCPASFYSVADLGADTRVGDRRLPLPPTRTAPTRTTPTSAGVPTSLEAIEEGIERLRAALDPPADPHDGLGAAAEEQRAAAAALARLGPGAPEAPMWEERAARAGQRADDLRAAARLRQRWAADHADDLARYAELLAAGATRRQALARAAELDPPAAVLAAIGPRPEDPGQRAAWRLAAGRLVSYRERWGLAGAERPLGPAPDGARQAAELREVTAAVRALARHRTLRLAPGRENGPILPGSGQAAPILEPAGRARLPELR